MGRKPGRPKRGQLADMTIPPNDAPGYELPDPSECEDFDDRIVLEAGHELQVRFRLWKGRLVVEFAIMQYVRHNGQWIEAARIDTCHGSVHVHQMHKSRLTDRQGQRRELQAIPPHNGWTVVDQWYDRALTLMKNEWTDNLRRWRRGRRA